MTTISHLPDNLLKDIVYRTPLKSTRSVRLTCKKWDNLLKNRIYGKDVTKTIEGESRMIVLMNDFLYLMSIVVNGDPYAEHKGKLIALNDGSNKVFISKVFHCEGLLLCILNNDDKFRLVVWNPYWGQTRWIEPKYKNRTLDGCDRYIYAFGYDNKTSRCHKILRFIDSGLDPPRHSIEIYTLESGLWTTFDVVNPNWCINYYHHSVSLKGNAYWCVTESGLDPFDIDHIICFDFTSERFGPLMRLPFRAWNECTVILSCVREEKLAALFCHEDGVDVWITTKIEANKVLWSKYLTLNGEIPIADTIQSFFIDEAKKVAMLCGKNSIDGVVVDTVDIIGEAGYIKQVVLGEPVDIRFCPLVLSYDVPSLVQIKQLEGGERKQQSESEKRPCDQNMSRLVPYEEPVTERYDGAGKRRKRDDV